MNKPIEPLFKTGMLAYARSLQISEGLFYGASEKDGAKEQGSAAKRVPIEILEKGVRGQSAEDKANNPGLSNPQSVEYAVVPQGCDRVDLEFTLRVMGNAMKPHACDDTHVGETYVQFAESYKLAEGFTTLAELYVWNIANARFAWRNRFQADQMSISLYENGNLTISFDPLKIDLSEAANREQLVAAMTHGSADDLTDLIENISDGLAGKAHNFTVVWSAQMTPGAEIFPSQEYIREEKADKQLSRVLAKLPTFHGGRMLQQASMHSQKIGAALRHIDVWHGDASYGAIAINPYGGVQETGAVLRAPSTKKSFYDIRGKAGVLLDSVTNASSRDELSDEAHFVMANLIRGGVFGSSSKKAEAKDAS